MRALIHNALTNTPALQSIVDDRIYPRGTLGIGGIPAQPEHPFIQWGEENATPYDAVRETSSVVAAVYRFYVYDDRGSFSRIDDIHALLRQTLVGLSGMVSPSGRRCTAVAFLSLGADLSDEGQNANIKIATYRFTAQR